LPELYLFSAFLLFLAALLSFYFFGVYANLFSSDRFYIPGFCRLSNNDCTSIVDTKYGRIFGISNALAGTIFLFSQTVVLVCTYLNLISNHYAFFMSLVSVSLGAYLIYGLIKLKVKCNVCITVHAINMIVFTMQLMNISQ
jgi:uncharacterized membrane protein